MTVHGIDATYYSVSDLERSTAFYTELLGAEPAITIAGFVSEWTFADGSSFGLHHSPGYEGGRRGSVMFAVEDVPAAMAEAKSCGVKFEDDDVTETPVCKMVFGRDPDDNQFILHQHK